MRTIIAQIIRFVVGLLAQFDLLFRLLFQNEKVIFCYHNVSSEPSEFENKNQLNHHPDIFETQLKVISELFETGDPSRLHESTNKTEFFITFDDGFEGALTEGLEIQKKHKIPAIHFLNMATVLKEEPYWVSSSEEIGQNYLDKPEEGWKERIQGDGAPKVASLDLIKSTEESNLTFFGNHLYNHINATVLSEEELKESYDRNKKCLEENLSKSVNYFAYPFGQPGSCYNEKSDRIIRELNPDSIFTANTKTNSSTEKRYFYRYSLSPQILTKSSIRGEILYQKIRSYFL